MKQQPPATPASTRSHPTTPLLPFGFGLSYTTSSWGSMRAAQTVTVSEDVDIVVTVRVTGP